jgi:hypothetical protein
LLPPVTKSPEQLEREKIEFAQLRKDSREGKVSALESLVRAEEKHLTLAQLREALKPKYYGDIRYKRVEGVPPAGSTPPPATQQPEGATSPPEKIEEGATNLLLKIEEGATIQPESAVGGATYLRGQIDRPIEGVKKKLPAAERLSRWEKIEVEEKQEEKGEEKQEEKGEEKQEEKQEEKGEEKQEKKGEEKEEEEDVLQLLNSDSEESGEESWEEVDSITEAEIEESLSRARRRVLDWLE